MSEGAQLSPIYQIEIAGRLDQTWEAWLNGLTITQNNEHPPVLTLTGPIVDQSKLRGVMNHLWDLNLTILALRRLD